MAAKTTRTTTWTHRIFDARHDSVFRSIVNTHSVGSDGDVRHARRWDLPGGTPEGLALTHPTRDGLRRRGG